MTPLALPRHTCSLNLCTLLISFDNTNFLTWCDWCLLHTALSSQLVHVHRGSWDAGWKKWPGIKRSVWMCLRYCRIKGVWLRERLQGDMCVDVDGWLGRCFPAWKSGCTTFTWRPHLNKLLAAHCRTNSSHSAYSALQPIHSPKQLIVHPVTFCEKSYLSYRFWVPISYHQLATWRRRLFPDQFQSYHLSLHYSPYWHGTTEEWKSSPVSCATLCKRIQNSQCIAAVEIESTQKAVEFLQKFKVASFLQYASQLLMTCNWDLS